MQNLDLLKKIKLKITLSINSYFCLRSICKTRHQNLYQHTCSQREDCNLLVLEFDQLGQYHMCTQNCQFGLVVHRFGFELKNSAVMRGYFPDVVMKHYKNLRAATCSSLSFVLLSSSSTRFFIAKSTKIENYFEIPSEKKLTIAGTSYDNSVRKMPVTAFAAMKISSERLILNQYVFEKFYSVKTRYFALNLGVKSVEIT